MKRLILLSLVVLSVVSQAQELSTNQEVLQRQINRLNLRKVNLRDSGSVYVSPSRLETRLAGVVGTPSDTGAVVMPWELGAYQLGIANIPDTANYMEYADTTAKIAMQWELDGKQAAGTYATPATVAESIDVYTMTMSGWNIGTIPVRLNDSTIISLVIPSDSTQAATGGVWHSTTDGIIRRKW